jgi:hypothetical protein
LIRSYRDTYGAAESLREAHYALTHAIAGTYSEAMSQLDAFNKIMSLSPQYLNYLLDERGALLHVEDAVAAVTQAQIDLMGVRQANAVLDAAQAWIDETGSLLGYHLAVDSATKGVWGLVEARMQLMRQGEIERVLALGAPMEAAGKAADAIMSRMTGQIEAIRGMTESAQASARERGVVRTDPRGAILVADVGVRDIMGEFVRMREDVARRDYMMGAYQQRGMVVVNMGGYNYTHSPNVYPAELSAAVRADIAREGAQRGAALVADMMEEAERNYLG